MMIIPPRTGPQAEEVLNHWSEFGGFDVATAMLFCRPLASKALKIVGEGRWHHIPLERLTDLITGLASCPSTAPGLMKLINKDKVPMIALSGEGFAALNRTLETMREG